MIKPIQKYTSTELLILLDSEVAFPEKINELDFVHQIQSNKRIRWDVNPFMLDEDCIRVLLNPTHFNQWRARPKIGQAIGIFIAYWCLKTRTVEMLLLVPIIPFTIVPLPHLFFIFCMGCAITAKLYFNLNIPLFWVIVGLIGVSFAFTKSADDLAKRLIIKQGLSDWETFWKYYSNQIIYPIWTYDIEEAVYLLERYPELAADKEENFDFPDVSPQRDSQ